MNNNDNRISIMPCGCNFRDV